MTLADLRRATAEAAASAVSGVEDDDATASAEGAADDTTNSDASSEGTSANGDEGDGDTSEGQEATDVPESYFGYQFPPDLTPEQRAELLGELKKRDDTIGKLLRGREEQAPPTDEPAPEPEPEITDEDILQALGLDPDNPFDETTAKTVIPIVRKQIEQENLIANLIEMQELAEIDRSWRSTLNSLEAEFGKLPAEVTHDQVMEFAADNGVSSPVDAYWRIMGPGRAAVEGLSAERARKAKLAADKAASSSVRPGSGNVTDEAPVTAKTVKGATREAAERILREMGLGT